ncbi:MAG: class I SAM-dependent methyltransferase [Chloroflexi bacterium]|nr:class I SAM-dependent methyltransferase [Chloroflexota bacterium]
MGQRRKYQVIEAALADTRRLLGYKLRAEPEIHLNLKGFDCGWILDSVAWRPGLRVLDVGAGYSWLPIYLAREKHCEVWSVDDFGTWDSDPFWERSRDPAEYIRAHPEVKYVLGRLGEDRRPDLPSGYFDCIYSASALEHVPVARFADVWTHMDGLLREGGHLLHAIDIAFPTSRGAAHVLLAALFDVLYPLLPKSLQTRFLFETPLSCVRAALRALGAPMRGVARRLSVVDMVIDPEVAVEPLEFTLNRLLKDGDARTRHFRVGSVLIHVLKT